MLFNFFNRFTSWEFRFTIFPPYDGKSIDTRNFSYFFLCQSVILTQFLYKFAKRAFISH